MPEILEVNGGAVGTTRELLRSLLGSGRVSGVLSLGRNGGGGVAYSLFTDAGAFAADGAALPLYPFMPANAGGLLSRLTLKGPLAEPIAAVVKPCELRACVEQAKLNQCNLDNVLFVSSTCGGVYPLDVGADGNLEKRLPDYWEAVKRGELAEGVRVACRACQHFYPENADVTVALFGEAGLHTCCTLYLNTEKGSASASCLEKGTVSPGEPEGESLQRFQDQREALREELFAGVTVGLQGLIDTFGRCIGCHACKTVCPICYCRLCYFDSQDCERTPEFFEGELERKGGLRVPPDTVFFQLGRMSHVGVSCVGCGMCTDVCPADIPLSTIFAKVGASVQALFDYQPGRDVAEEIPLRTFEEDELVQVAV